MGLLQGQSKARPGDGPQELSLGKTREGHSHK